MSGENPFDEPDPMATPDASDFFSGGSPSCKFNTIGDMHRGTILSFEKAQQKDIATGEPKTWPDGNPRMMLVVTLQTTERDPDNDDDDGTRRLYVNQPGGIFSAIKKALGANKFLPGGTLAVKYTKNGKPTRAGYNAPKEYMAHYVPPGVNGNGGQSAPAPTRVAASLRQQQKPVGEEVLGDSEFAAADIPF
jgi:hypothetical protein